MRLQPVAPSHPAPSPTRRVLPGAIAAYRAHLSGRGPLRRVRCTFERTESCSAYGLRISQEAAIVPSLMLIARRLRHCGCLSLYRDRDRGVWLWHIEHEDRTAEALDADLARSGELTSTRAAVLRANALVGCELGDAARVAACRALLAALGEMRSVETAPEQLLVRGAAGWFAKTTRRWRTRVAMAIVVSLTACGVLLGSGASVAAAFVCLAGVALVVRASFRRARDVSRAEGLLASGAFTPPDSRAAD